MLFDRFNVKRPTSKRKTFPAPRKGWIKNEVLVGATPDGAEVLDNIYPTSEGGRLRKGKSKHATIPAAAQSLFVWKGGASEKMFAATTNAIYDVTSPADPDVAPSADVSGLSNGVWTVQQFSNSGGEYIVLANGVDSVREYDGATWTTPTITGVSSATLAHVWAFKSRLFFVEENSLSAWYLATDAISGAATEFPLNGVFNLGGSLLFGATWSLDSGSGLDDVCIFVTSEGEIAVYQGSDPGSDFVLSGVYRIGRPLHKDAHFSAGGDVAIMTEDGIIPVSEALRKDRAAIQAVALTFPIEDEWRNVVANRSANHPFPVTLWHSQSLLMIGTPNVVANVETALIANSRTGAWGRYVGWDVRCSTIYNDSLYFGQEDATVWAAESGGSDGGLAYAGVWVPKFADDGALQKMAVHARFRGRGTGEYPVGMTVFADYDVGGAIPSVAGAASTSGSLWGTAIWGTATWGTTGVKTASIDWQSVTGLGSALSPALRIEVNRVDEPDLELIAMDMMYHEGAIF